MTRTPVHVNSKSFDTFDNRAILEWSSENMCRMEFILPPTVYIPTLVSTLHIIYIYIYHTEYAPWPNQMSYGKWQ